MTFSAFDSEPPRVFHEASVGGRHGSLSTWMFGVLIAVLLVVIGALMAANQALSGMLSGRDAALRAQENVRILKLDLALDDLLEAQDSFERALRGLRFLAPLSFVPSVGDDYRAARALAATGAASARVFARTLETGLEIMELIGEDESLLVSSNKKGEALAVWTRLPRERRAFILSRVGTRLPSLEVARNELHLALKELDEAFPGNVSPALFGQKKTLTEGISQAQSLMETFLQGAALLTALSDEDGGHILLLFLNDNELRPGGGFLGSFGLLTLDAGAVADLKTYDVMAVDGPVLESRRVPPPEPVGEYLGVPAWFLRDANWSPDFALSSERVLEFFADELAAAGEGAVIDAGIEIDAVVGLTTSIVGDFLAVLGDVEVEGERFTSENIADALENAVEFTFANRGVTHERRKDIIQAIADIMRDRFARLSLEEWSRIFTSVSVRLTDKHLMFYSPDADVERLFARQDWAGLLAEQFDGDYLMVVDANLASLKSDPAVRRVIDYRITRDGDDLIATTAITYEHTRPFDPKTTRYRTFTRLYVPEGSELISVGGTLANDRLKNPSLLPDEPVVGRELGKTVFGAFTSVEPLTTGTLTFTYRLPDRLLSTALRGEYDLLIQKQLGAQNHALTLDLDFGTKLKRAVPSEEMREWGDERYKLNTILDRDISFNLDL